MSWSLFIFISLLAVTTAQYCSSGLSYSGNHVRILGAGVIGLTNGLSLQKMGFRVTIYANTIPSSFDPETDSDPYYASGKAGAWIAPALSTSHSDLKMMEDTYHSFMGMNVTEPEATIIRRTAKLMFPTMPTGDDYLQKTSVSKYAKNFRNMTNGELNTWGAGTFAFGISWETTVVDAHAYVKFLEREFLYHGGQIVVGNIAHISELTNLPDTDLVLNCAGIGARSLGGVEDRNVYGVRGQLVLVRQPEVTDIYRVDGSLFGEDPSWGTYILPRKSGIIILGGTRSANDEDFTIRPETKADILNRTKFLEPRLANAEFVKDVVCMRPARNGSAPRIELDTTFAVPLIHCYGHSGSGFEKSWGSAVTVQQLIQGLSLTQKECTAPLYYTGLPSWVVPVVAVGWSLVFLLLVIIVLLLVAKPGGGGADYKEYTG